MARVGLIVGVVHVMIAAQIAAKKLSLIGRMMFLRVEGTSRHEPSSGEISSLLVGSKRLVAGRTESYEGLGIYLQVQSSLVQDS